MIPPTGTVTFLFTDIEGSTQLWEEHAEPMRLALARHDALLREVIGRHNGYVFKTMGDSFFATFATAPAALAAALTAQRELLAEPWPETVRIRVRMALHTGTAEFRDSDYFGPPLNSVSRLLAAGHGAQTLLSHAVYDLVRDSLPPSCSLLNLGEHRLKDLARTETIFQLLHPDLPAEFAPLRSVEVEIPNNLPWLPTSFIGREKQIGDIKTLLAGSRLLTLVGAGGCGKTRLALQVAAELLDQFPQGVWLVDLAPLTDASLVLQTIALVLGLREEPGKPAMLMLTDYLKPKRPLLLLDNCEHLIAETATTVEGLLRACPNVKILATSREGLNIAGESVYRVPSLTLPPLPAPPPSSLRGAKAGEQLTLESLIRYEAVRLFLDRSRMIAPDFRVTNADVMVLAALCHRLDGIPLALELAAARTRSLSLEEINSRLDQSFRLLTGGSRTALPRQQTLQALIDWSYSLLTGREQALLCRLSAFAGGWTLAAAEAICSTEPLNSDAMLDLLTALVDKSLVLLERQESGTRYRLLATMRQYAHDRLVDRGEDDDVRNRHRDYYLALAEAVEPKLMGAAQGAWLEHLETEHDNLRAALAWSCNRQDEDAATKCESPDRDSKAGLRLCGALWRFWAAHGYLREGRAWCAAALQADGAADRTSARAKALSGAGGLARIQGDYEAARSYYEESLAIEREIGNRPGIATSLNGLGLVAYNQGDYVAAQARHEESLAIRRVIGDRWGIALSLGNLGNVVHNQGDYEAARSYHEESLAIRQEVGDRQGTALSLAYLGHVARDQDDYAAAEAHYEECLKIRRQAGDRWGIASSLENFADLAAAKIHALNAQGDITSAAEQNSAALQRAARLWGAAQALRERMGAPLSPVDRAKQEREVAASRAKLGKAEWEAAWAEGLQMTQEQAVTYALERSHE